MYPTVVIVLVETQRSIEDICEINPSNASKLAGLVASEARPATVGPLLAVGLAHIPVDNEAGSQPLRTLQIQGGREHDLEQVILEVKESQVGNSG
jgi:hypothetical protein